MSQGILITAAGSTALKTLSQIQAIALSFPIRQTLPIPVEQEILPFQRQSAAIRKQTMICHSASVLSLAAMRSQVLMVILPSQMELQPFRSGTVNPLLRKACPPASPILLQKRRTAASTQLLLSTEQPDLQSESTCSRAMITMLYSQTPARLADLR